jgi:CubicO group peptidase (beta-lactamase class C family)
MKRKGILILFSILIQISCFSQANSDWDSVKLKKAEDYSKTIGTFAFMLITNGKVVSAWGDTTTPTNLQSARKAISSTIYYTYIDKGILDPEKTLALLGIDDYPNPLTKLQKQAKVIHLLKCISGINHAADAEIQKMRDERDQRLGATPNIPGTKWAYNNWDINALNTIFEQESQISEKQVFLNNIAHPIGMQDINENTVGFTKDTSMSLHPAIQYNLSARDMAKFGQLCLNKGNWEGKQLVPKEYFEKIVTDYTETGNSGWGSGHGYLWWVPCDSVANMDGIPEGTFYASGAGSQRIIVIPKWNTVIIHKSLIKAEEGIKLFAIQSGYTEEYVMNNLESVVEEFIDFIYNKCDEPEYSDNEICLKCKPVDISDFYTLMKMVFDARIK